MATSTDFVCDLTGEVLTTSAIPVVVRIQVAVVPGAQVDPRPESLHPFLRRMLFHPDGSARPGHLELGGRAFGEVFAVDLEALEPAFLDQPTPAEQLLVAHQEIARLKAQLASRTTTG